MQQLAIFGGTFDPIHWGHLLIAETALHQLPLDQIIWVPSLNPPHKQAAPFEHRVKMLQLVTQENPAFTVSLVETSRTGTSYAINTFIDLSAIYSNALWYWIVGLDTFQTLPRWYRGHELAQMCDWLIAPRQLDIDIVQSDIVCQQVEQQLRQMSSTIRWQFLDIPLVGVSSSHIRKLCCESKSIKSLVPEPVRFYITTHNLYSEKSE
ncbi:nicotinate (nicotinamide) nucleotide adenylyltransferase [Nostoc sp. PCC 7107]|uniref:nicotinate (nicotinamide) nucleotide adenylyltransferase n=1 Tax=Nostoc sp. PCC 7107 TaxID=317936 RepID=UPI00029EC955|nr:nicotinate (nicotinamide) nucleotide adenylyltransferase [Nostoc sp. PCC 7107]AFY42879.1 nicotinate-nucleotide adenylyltransferase [Nostoc sp. PCC 7107]